MIRSTNQDIQMYVRAEFQRLSTANKMMDKLAELLEYPDLHQRPYALELADAIYHAMSYDASAGVLSTRASNRWASLKDRAFSALIQNAP